MKRPMLVLMGVAVLTAVASRLVQAQSQTPGDRALHFVVEFVGDVNDTGKSLTLDMTFHDKRPTTAQVDEALRSCLKAAAAIHLGADIAANAWYAESSSAAERQKLTLTDGVEGLLFVVKDRTTRSVIGGSVSEPAAGASQDGAAAILEDAGVASACKSVAKERMSSLVGAASAEAGRERKYILKAMRTWSKKNDVIADRSLRSCMSAISKAVVATAKSQGATPADLADAIARGATGYVDNGCAKCHLADGGGGPRGPSLLDAKWDHCDGSIKGIRAVLVSGVPRNKLKDASRPFAMKPVGGPGTSDEDLSDLAAYVYSLSHQ